MNSVIVCIDDEEIILSSLRKDIAAFLGSQYSIEVAMSGEEALDLIKELIQDRKEIPLVISDYIMPGMKGDELLAKVHQLLPKTLKIMLTGQANMQGIVNAINYAQLYRYIPKPWEKEDLKLAVREACDKYFREKLLEKQNQELKELTQSLERKVVERTFELQKKAEELAEKNRQLSEANELKVRIFSVISHDIREPISALQGVLDILSDKTYLLSPEEIKEAAQELSVSVKKTVSFLENLLQWAKNQMQNINPNFQVISLQEIVQENIELFRNKFLQKGIEVLNQVPPQLTVKADMEMLKTVLRNLLNNAIKFTDKNGKIFFKAVENTNNTVTVTIEDTGVGIAPENLTKIFNLKESFTTTGTLQEKGTGLGLSICKEFVERQGGKIWVESQVGQGTKFHFTLAAK